MPLLTRPSRREFFRLAGSSALASKLVLAQGNSKSIHWAILSDTHLATDQKNEYRGFRPYDNLKRVIPEVQRANPDVVLINGDLARLEGIHSDYELLKSMMQPIADRTPIC